MPTRREWLALAGAAGLAAQPALAMRQRLLALDAVSLSAADVREVLAGMPAPRLIALHGSVPLLTMAPFAEFLIDMGYPEAALRHPADGRLSLGSFGDSRELAGSLAWHYEREGLMPMLLGHSQGGMRVIEVLHQLASSSGAAALQVWDPVQGRALGRDTLVDPIDGSTRSVAGLQLPMPPRWPPGARCVCCSANGTSWRGCAACPIRCRSSAAISCPGTRSPAAAPTRRAPTRTAPPARRRCAT